MLRYRLLSICCGVAILLAAGTAQANFTLSGTQHLDLADSHSTGTLNDYSSVDVLAGGAITNAAHLNNDSTLRLRADGRVANINANHNSDMEIYGGSIDYIRAYGSHSISICGGDIYSLETFGGTSKVTMSNGDASYLMVDGASTFEMLGGFVRVKLAVFDTTTGVIRDGTVEQLNAAGSSIVDVFGGDIETINANGSSIITLHCYDYSAYNGLQIIGNRVLGTGTLSGRWTTGSAWTLQITNNAASATILVPAPPTLSLLALPNELPSDGHFLGVLEILLRDGDGSGLEGLAASIVVTQSGAGAVVVGPVTDVGGGLYRAGLAGAAKGEVTLSVAVAVGGWVLSAHSLVIVYTQGEDGWPVANAGPNQYVTDLDQLGSEMIILNGAGSHDNEGPISSWLWFLNGSEIASDQTAAVILAVGVHNIVLVVEDAEGHVDMDEVRVCVNPPLGISASLDHDWVYQNTEVTTQDRHQCTLTVRVSANALAGEVYQVTSVVEAGVALRNFRLEAGSLPATLVPVGDELVGHIDILGGRRGESIAPLYQALTVTVAGQQRGQVATVNVPLVLRTLGDIDGDGAVTAADKLQMNKALNGLATLPGIGLRELDLTGDGVTVNAEDKLVINQVLNGLAVP